MDSEMLFFRSVVIQASLILGLSSSLAFAKIAIQTDFTGTLLITSPDGNIDMYDEGETVPEILPNSVIEVFGGKFTITTEAGDSVSCSCLNHTIAVGGGASAALSCEEESGLVKVLKGSVTLIDPEDKEHIIPEGKEFSIKPSPGKPAPATEAAEEIGASADTDLPPVDSRSIEASQSQ